MASYAYLVDLDLNGNRILNAVVESLTSAPTPKAGKFYYNSTLKRFSWSNGSDWLYFTEVESVAQPNNELSLIDSTTNNVIKLRVLKGSDYITIGQSNGIINLTLEYESLWQYYNQLRIQAHFITYEDMGGTIDLEIGECVYCTTTNHLGIYQYTGEGEGLSRWIQITDEHGVFIRSGQVTEDNLSTAYKASLQDRFNALSDAITNLGRSLDQYLKNDDIVVLTQNAYDALSEKDPDKYYLTYEGDEEEQQDEEVSQ